MPDISYAGASATQTRRKERGKSSATDPTSSAEPDHNSSSNRGEKKAEYINLEVLWALKIIQQYKCVSLALLTH